jgi:hypothetical protein
LSTHRSPNNSKHRAPQRPLRKRTKTVVVGVVAVGLSGAAYSAHANFGRAHLGSGHTVASDGVTTASPLSFDAKSQKAPGYPDPWPWWPPHPTSSPTKTVPTEPKPTSEPTSEPTTTSPKPTTTSPTTTSPTTTSPTTSEPTTSSPTTTSPASPSGSDFPGLIPGQFYLGMSCGTLCPTQEAKLGRDYGLHRSFKSWGNWGSVARVIQQDHHSGRLPWVSVKGPGGASTWQAVANGSYDDQIRQLAEVLKANDDQPIFLTFHHEPSNDASDAQGAQWAAAYCHLHDVLANAGALGNVADPPIVGDWLFNARNPQNPENWLTDAVMRRMPFLGVDIYENSSGETYADRIPPIIDWMQQRGYNKMVGIGETGSTDYYDASTAVRWMNDSLGWAAANTDKVVAVSYFNSTAHSRAGVYWPLDESEAKMAAYRSWLGNTKSID